MITQKRPGNPGRFIFLFSDTKISKTLIQLLLTKQLFYY